MGERLSPEDNELYRRVDEVLFYVLDPIRVASVPCARGEYYSYSPKIFSMLRSGVDSREISDHLVEIERDNMGLRASPDKAREVADILLEYRRKIREDNSWPLHQADRLGKHRPIPIGATGLSVPTYVSDRACQPKVKHQ